MARFGVTPEKEGKLLRRMAELGISESDIDEQFIKGSGPGGQKVNKTSCCVQLRHPPTCTEVRCQTSRSQALNRFLARREVCEKIAAKEKRDMLRRQSLAAKIRRQKRRRSKRAKEKVLRAKHFRSQVKQSRRKPPLE